MPKIILTGASGFIGRACYSELSSRKLHVLRAGRNDADDIFCDLAKPSSVLALRDVGDYDAIVHLGAYVGLGSTSLEEMYIPNVLSTAILADLARERRASLVFSSTAIVAGMLCEEIRDDSPLCPDTPYAKSKAIAEACIEASGVQCCILRIGGVFGLNGPTHLGLNRAINGAINGAAPVIFGDGSGLRNYIHSADLAKIISDAVQDFKAGTHCVAGPETLSIREMMTSVSQVFLGYPDLELRAGDSTRSQIINATPRFVGQSSFRTCLRKIQIEAVGNF